MDKENDGMEAVDKNEQSLNIFCFSVFHCLEKENFLKNLHVLCCFVQLKSVLFNLVCVWDLKV